MTTRAAAAVVEELRHLALGRLGSRWTGLDSPLESHLRVDEPSLQLTELLRRTLALLRLRRPCPLPMSDIRRLKLCDRWNVP